MRKNASKFGIILAGGTFAALVFLTVAIILLNQPGTGITKALPFMVILWLAAMSLFHSPAVSLIDHFVPAERFPQAAAKLRALIAEGGDAIEGPFDGEEAITLLADLEAGATGGLYRQAKLPDLTESPIPRFDLVNFKDYIYVGLQYSRGCPYNCEFCNVIDLFDHRYRTKSIDQVLRELQVLYDLGYRGQLDFFDDNLVGSIKEAKPLMRALAGWLKAHKYPFQLSTSVTLNVAKDDELLDLMREARFKYLLVGIETPDENALRAAHKPHNTGFSIAEAVDRIYTRAGATVHSGFLIGLDGEARDIGDRIIRCIDETSIPWVMAGIVYPLPGTQLTRRLDREGRLFPKARKFNDERVRDQISAGLQFRPERPAPDVVKDLLRVLEYSFDPKNYFDRCAKVASRLNTVPVLIPGWRIFFRNARAFMRLCWRATMRRRMRAPFWKAFWKVLFKNSRGVEALATLSILYMHFESILPYCREQLGLQLAEMERKGPEAWLLEELKEPEDAAA